MGMKKIYSSTWIISGLLLFAWWPLYGAILPAYGSEFTEMVASPYWSLVNIIAVFGLLFLIFSCINLFYSFKAASPFLRFSGLVVLTIGNILFLCEEIVQTFIFPILLKSNLNLLLLNGVYFTSNYVKINAFVWGILSVLGFSVMGYLMVQNKVVPKLIAVGILIGAVLFYISPLIFGVFGSTVLRTIGLMMLGIMFISIGVLQLRSTNFISENIY